MKNKRKNDYFHSLLLSVVCTVVIVLIIFFLGFLFGKPIGFDKGWDIGYDKGFNQGRISYAYDMYQYFNHNNFSYYVGYNGSYVKGWDEIKDIVGDRCVKDNKTLKYIYDLSDSGRVVGYYCMEVRE